MRLALMLNLLGCRTSNIKTNDGVFGNSNPEDTAYNVEENSESGQEENTDTSNPNDGNSDSGISSDDLEADEGEMENGTDPIDSDNDGIIDGDEQTLGTDPNDEDSDDDGLSDGDELVIGSDPNDADSDDDGLSDGDEVSQGTDPTDADTDDDGIDDGDEITNGTDPTDDGLEDDTGDFWDWGDNANSDCPNCDPAIFSGIYDLDLTFQSSINSTILCTTTSSAFLSSLGDIDFTASCTTSTGASFDFGFDLSITYDNPYATEDYAILFGTVSITLPNGTVISETFAPNTLSSVGIQGYVTTLAPANFGPYHDISFLWRPLIQTPSGQIEYIIYFQGFQQ